jgi:hypothetical protein
MLIYFERVFRHSVCQNKLKQLNIRLTQHANDLLLVLMISGVYHYQNDRYVFFSFTYRLFWLSSLDIIQINNLELTIQEEQHNILILE